MHYRIMPAINALQLVCSWYSIIQSLFFSKLCCNYFRIRNCGAHVSTTRGSAVAEALRVSVTGVK